MPKSAEEILAELDDVVPEGDVLTPGPRPGLSERFFANRAVGYYTGTLGGAVKGAGSQDLERELALKRYEAMPQWETPLEGAAALAGQLSSQANPWEAPENIIPIGLGGKALVWAGIKTAPVVARFAAGAIDAGVANLAADTAIQGIEIGAGTREGLDPVQLAASLGLGMAVGGAAGTLTRGAGPERTAPTLAKAPESAAPEAPAKPPAPAEAAPAAPEGFGEVLDQVARQRRELGPRPKKATPAKSGGDVKPPELWTATGEGRQLKHGNAEATVVRLPDSKEWRAEMRFGDQSSWVVSKSPLKTQRAAEDWLDSKGAFDDSYNPTGGPDELLAAAQPSASRHGALERDQAGVAATAASPQFTRVKDIAEKLAQALEAPAVRPGRVTAKAGAQKAAGQFSPKSGVIRVAKPDDFDVLAHELGHHVEVNIGRPVKQLMAAHQGELLPMAYAGARKGQELKEGFAEFMRLFVTNPAYARAHAPLFDRAFRDFLRQQHPELLAALDQAALEWRAWLDQPSAQAVASTIVSGKEPKFFAKARKDLAKYGFADTIGERLSRTYTALFDDLNPLNKAVRELAQIYRDNTGRPLDLKVAEDPYKLARLSRGAYNSGHMDISYGVTPHNGTQPGSASLRDALIVAMDQPNVLSHWDDTLIQTFGSYLWSRRALGEWRRFDQGLIPNPPDKLTRGDHTQNIADLERLNPQFVEAASMVHEWAQALWTKKRDAGLITHKQWAEGAAITDYVPGLRAFDQAGDAAGIGGKSGDAKAGFVKRFRGSRRDVINPVESLMSDAYETAMAIARNEVVKKLDRLALAAGPGGGAIAERIASHEIKATMVDPLEVVETAARAAGMSAPDAMVLRDAFESAVGPDPVAIFRPAIINEKGEAIAFFRDGGELKALRLADGEFGRQMYAALTMMTRGEAGVFTELMAKPAAVLRTGITAAPEFILANFIRDQATAMIFYGKPLRRLVATVRGMGEEVFGREAARAYNQAGGIMGGANVAALSDVRVRSDLDGLRKRGWAVQKLTSVKGLIEATELSETGMRLGLFRTFYDEAKGRGLSDIEAQLEAAWRARDHLDFNRRGSQMTAMARLIPFLNASMQGLDKTGRHMLAPLFRTAAGDAEKAARATAAKSWARLAALTIASVGVHALMSENDEYLDLSTQTRATHWMIKWGDNWLAVPKPFELGAIINLGEAAYDAMARRDPRWASRYMEGLYEVAMPPNVMEGNPLIASAYELASGVNLRTGAPIIPEGMEGMEPWLQFSAKTSEISKMLGKAINVSPAIVDQVITAHTGSQGRNALALYDYAASDKPTQGWEDFAVTRRFIKDAARGASSTRAFWDLVSTRTGTLEGARKSWQAMLDGGDAAGAADFLAEQDEVTRAWIAAGSVEAGVRRIHPLARARLAVTAINNLRREMADAKITTADGEFDVPRPARGAANDILEQLAMTEARNALVLMQVPGWADREPMETAGYFRELEAVSPEIAQALADRFATAKVMPQDAMERLWPVLRERLLRDGSEMRSADLAARAKAAGFEMQGKAMKRRKRGEVPAQE